jgi:hypothetical protein
MDDDFYKQHAQRVRDLADKADPFTRKRLLDLADKYDAKTAWRRSRAGRVFFRGLKNQSVPRPGCSRGFRMLENASQCCIDCR